MLTRAAGQSIPVPVPVRFGGEGAPEHQLLLRSGPIEPDGPLRCAVVWDPLLQRFVWGIQVGVDRLAVQLDPLSTVFGRAGRGVSEVFRVVVAGLLSPGFILAGGIVDILAACLIYHTLRVMLAGRASWYVILPGVASAVACLVVFEAPRRRLRAGRFEAAYSAIGVQGPA
ncbi:MAG: hypothetical protein ACRYHQ_11835 [Janthinobacterium lividum]